MYDERYNRRQMRRRYRNPMGGLAVGIFIIGLVLPFTSQVPLVGTCSCLFYLPDWQSFHYLALPVQAILKVIFPSYCGVTKHKPAAARRQQGLDTL